MHTLFGLTFNDVLDAQRELSAIADLKLFTIGKDPITLWTTVYLLVLSWLLVQITGRVERLFERRVLSRTKIDRGTIEGMGAALRYALTIIGLVVLFQSAGIDLSALTVMAGAVGVAVGLGLQSMMSNLVGGLVILFERPIKIGDRIDVGGTVGDVTHVSLRATTIQTNEGVTLIVPNSEFVTSKVINWTYAGKKCALKVPIKVTGIADPHLVKELLLEVARSNSAVLKNPEPTVWLEEFGDDAPKFALSVWTSEFVDRPNALRSELNFAIAEKFAEHGIQLPGLAPAATNAPDSVFNRSQSGGTVRRAAS